MADESVTVGNTTGGTADYDVAVDTVGGKQYQRVKLDLGADGAVSPVSGSVPINDNSGNISIDDGGNSITVDQGTAANLKGLMQITDGTDIADVLDLVNSNPLAAAIVDGSGTQITSFGGGTQYTEADTDATITGTAVMWEDTADTLRAVSAAKPLPVTASPTRAATPAQSSVAGNASSASLLASNASRLGATLFNDSSSYCYVRLGSTASTSNYSVKMEPYSYYEVPFTYSGAIDGIWAAATGNMRITELT